MDKPLCPPQDLYWKSMFLRDEVVSPLFNKLIGLRALQNVTNASGSQYA